jgi:hypothetical protein
LWLTLAAIYWLTLAAITWLTLTRDPTPLAIDPFFWFGRTNIFQSKDLATIIRFY